MPGPYRRLVVILIRTSKYDDDGYVVRHWRGTLPSNTLSCLNSLTEDVVRSGELGPIEVRVEVIDEIVSRVVPAALGRRHRRDGTKVVAGLVESALADLRLPELPAAPSRAWVRRWVTRLNPLSLNQFEYDPALLTWNLARGIRQSLGFLVAMHGERY